MTRRRTAFVAILSVLALYCFVLALDLLKQGASGVAALLQWVAAHGFVNLLGFGWLAAYVSLSGSPVAAVSLGLLGGGATSAVETLGMIIGSRMGASFVVLVTGFLYYLRGGTRGRGVISMGILSMLTTATTYLPAMPLAIALVHSGWLDPVRFGSSAWTTSFLDTVVSPFQRALPEGIPALARFGAGYALLLISFRLFDRALPRVSTEQLRQDRWGSWLSHPATMFVLGLLVAALTLSVSVSLSILVPLAARGLVGRTTVVPYIMGANITTFIDTLFAALLITTPAAFTVVLSAMLAVTAVSVAILLTIFGAYQQALLTANSAIAATKTRFALFVGAIALVPLVLVAL